MLTLAGTTTPTPRRRDGGRNGIASVLLLFDSPVEARNPLFLIQQGGRVAERRAMLLLLLSHELLLVVLAQESRSR